MARPCRAAGPGCLQCLHSDIVGCVPAVEVTTVDMPSRTRQPHTTGSAGVPPFCPQVIHHRQGRGAPTRVRARNFACPALLMWHLSAGVPITIRSFIASSLAGLVGSISFATNTFSMLRKAVVVETPQLGHATYVFAKPRSMDSFLSTYTKIRKDDVRRNRNNAAERLGFLGRVVHGTNPRTWLKEIPKPETHAMLLPTTQTKTFAVIGHQAAGSGTTTRESHRHRCLSGSPDFHLWRKHNAKYKRY